ncbi:MAG: proprotein convertase P-domain-containing protein, partial [Candidatus Eisenbacteria sp.]|nr:proprotein convertase P-domain-containing protein [Candidatus Eisenbacteria bacterium]
GVTLNVTIGKVEFTDVMTREGPFVVMTVSPFARSQQVGEPNLPVAGKLISIPYGCQLSAIVIDSEVQELSLSSLGLTNPIIPVQPSLSKSDDPMSVPFEFKRAVYEQRGYYALPPVDVKVAGTMRGVRLGRVSVAPVQYDPVENKLRVYTSLTVRISFDGADWALTDEQRKKYYSPFFEPLYAGLINYGDQVSAVRDDLVTHPVKYLIISDPMFADQLQPFIEWKTRKGFTIITAYTNVIGSSNSAIKSYIESLYDAGTVEDPAPSFVLFVGDAQQIPAWSGSAGYHITDLRYCEFSSPSDDFPEIYYGRFSAQNTAELQPQIDKTLEYEQYLMPDPTYLAEVTLVSGVDHSYASTFGNGQINYGTDYYFNAAHGITPHVWLYPASDASGAAAAIIQTISDGAGFYNYTAHCNHAGHANPPFTTADIPDLTNYHQYLLGIGNCCLPNTFGTDYSTPCFGEAFLQVADKGGIGYIGGTNSTYWDEDYWWGVGYTASIVSNPTYEQSGLGAYDGLFHDHGEDMDQWYVVNDAIIFSGNLAVMESGSYMTTYYWNIYNLMGDPSLCIYLGVPTANPVTHPETIFTTWTSITVEAVPGSYVGLTKEGELIGAGTVDESGSLELDIWANPLTPGPAHIVVMAQNREPYTADINVIVPATVYIDPDVIDANVETDITVGVFEYDGVTPRPGIEVWADGLEYESDHAFTDATGYCTITVNYPYGPTLDIVGQDPADPWELFRIPIEVNALALTGPDLWVTTEIGLLDTFALNLPGVLHAQLVELGHTLWAFLNGALVDSTSAYSMEITPAEVGELTGIIAVSGYDLYMEAFPVIEAYGTLTGHVDAAGSPAVGAAVKGFNQAEELVFEAVTNAQGDYDVGEEILVAPYTVIVDYFGYLHWEEPFFLNCGENVLDIDLTVAPAGVLTGTITEAGTGDPLEGTVKVYRSDTMELYTQVAVNTAGGSYTTDPLPYFDYVVEAQAFEHATVTIDITIDQPIVERNFLLFRVYQEENCEQPGLYIGDNTTVSDDMEIAIGSMATIAAVEVYVNITHTYIGDLTVEVTSPGGTTVTLHDRSGGSANNIIGWYPSGLQPAESLDAFIGEPTDGTWTLTVGDHASGDTGMFNEWCLRITYADYSADVKSDPVPARLELMANRPNPANAQTTIRFDLPAATEVDLAVFDVAGRRVATLFSGHAEAGQHAEIWQGRDDAGMPLSGAVYFYRLKVEGKTLTRKMMLLR